MQIINGLYGNGESTGNEGGDTTYGIDAVSDYPNYAECYPPYDDNYWEDAQLEYIDGTLVEGYNEQSVLPCAVPQLDGPRS
jgi:hypothetical protein